MSEAMSLVISIWIVRIAGPWLDPAPFLLVSVAAGYVMVLSE